MLVEDLKNLLAHLKPNYSALIGGQGFEKDSPSCQFSDVDLFQALGRSATEQASLHPGLVGAADHICKFAGLGR
jgi:hypothetical protein